MSQKNAMDQDPINSFKSVVDDCKYKILVHQVTKEESLINVEETTLLEEQPSQNITTWNQTETLALINIFSLFRDKFKKLKSKKEQWNMIAEELLKIGIYKMPEKCEIKWKNLLRIYRQHKNGHQGHGKFEFFNELDNIVANDNQFKCVVANPKGTLLKNLEERGCKRSRCCKFRDKQKRHNDRMKIMVKKMEIEERKVKAFEEYLKFLKNTIKGDV